MQRLHSSWVAHQYHLAGQLAWLEVKVKYRTVFIDDQFGRREVFLIHSYLISRLEEPLSGCAMLARISVSAWIFFIL